MGEMARMRPSLTSMNTVQSAGTKSSCSVTKGQALTKAGRGSCRDVRCRRVSINSLATRNSLATSGGSDVQEFETGNICVNTRTVSFEDGRLPPDISRLLDRKLASPKEKRGVGIVISDANDNTSQMFPQFFKHVAENVEAITQPLADTYPTTVFEDCATDEIVGSRGCIIGGKSINVCDDLLS